MLKLSAKQLAKREAFLKIGKAISAMKKIGDPNAPDYFTGKKVHLYVSNGKTHDPKMPHEIPFAPKFKTPQWIRTLGN